MFKPSSPKVVKNKYRVKPTPEFDFRLTPPYITAALLASRAAGSHYRDFETPDHISSSLRIRFFEERNCRAKEPAELFHPFHGSAGARDND